MFINTVTINVYITRVLSPTLVPHTIHCDDPRYTNTGPHTGNAGPHTLDTPNCALHSASNVVFDCCAHAHIGGGGEEVGIARYSAAGLLGLMIRGDGGKAHVRKTVGSFNSGPQGKEYISNFEVIIYVGAMAFIACWLSSELSYQNRTPGHRLLVLEGNCLAERYRGSYTSRVI
uniref:Uncharacterized protein n=1 Tax=Timema monikensis TaxID=170555 RepID=A0A7R9EJ46_9NEOP|nr:unnamed protein product [Timema monikensis]